MVSRSIDPGALLRLIRNGKYTSSSVIDVFNTTKGIDIKSANEVFNIVRNDGKQSDVIYSNYLGFLAREGDAEGMKRGIKMANIDGIKDKLEWKSIFLQLHSHKLETSAVSEILSSLSSQDTLRFLSPMVMEYIVKKAPNRDFLNELYKYWRDMKDNIDNQYSVTNAFCKQAVALKDYDLGIEICGLVFNSNMEHFLKSNIYVAFINGLIVANEFHKAEELIKILEVKLNHVICNNFINEYAKKWDMEKVSYWMEVMHREEIRPDIQTFNSLITAAINFNKMEMVEYFLSEMRSVDIQPSVVTFNIIMDTVLSSGDTKKVISYLKEMRKSGIVPDEVTFRLAIGSAIKKGDISRSEEMRVLFKDMGMRPTLDNYVSIIVLNMKRGNIKGFRHWVKAAKNEGFRLRPGLYTGLVKTAVKRLETPEEFDLVNEMLADGVEFTEELCNICVFKAAKMGIDHEIVRWLKYIEDNNMKVDEKAYPALIGRAIDHNNYEVVESWLKRATAAGFKSPMIYNTLIHAASAMGGTDKILFFMREMRREGIQPDVFTYAHLIANACTIGKLERVKEYLEIMRNSGLRPNAFSFAPVLQYAAERGEEEYWLELLDKEGVERDLVVYKALLKGAALGKKLKKVEEYTEILKRQQKRQEIV